MEIVSPEGADSVLASDVPHVHVEALVLDCFDVEADRRNRGDMFAEFKLVENGRLAGGVESEHQAARLAVPEPLLEEIAEEKSHFKNELKKKKKESSEKL